MLDVAPLLTTGRASCARPAALASSGATATKKRPEKVGERILIAEEIVHLFFGHRAVTARAHVDRPGAALAAHVAERRAGTARPWSLAGLRLLVHPPVRAELVVLLPLVGIAQDLVRFVDFLEARLGRLVPRIDVRMKLAGELAVRLLDLFFRRRLRDAEGLVIVLEFHYLALEGPDSSPFPLSLFPCPFLRS